MKPVSHMLLRSLGAILVGALLIYFPQKAGNYFIIMLGAVFMVPSLISLISSFVNRNEGEYPLPIAAIGGLLFGLILMLMPEFFASFLSLAIGFCIILGSVCQIIKLFQVRRQTGERVSGGYFVLPVLVFLSGVFALINPLHFERLIMIILGVTAIIYGCVELVAYIRFSRRLSRKDTSVEVAQPQDTDLMKSAKEAAFVEEDIQDAEIVDEDEKKENV